MDLMPAVASPAPRVDAAHALRDWMDRHPRLFVLTGAGCSTASGIPDYRDGNGDWKRSPPVSYQAFVASEAAYRRYWARSSIGWPRFLAARPNTAHLALAALERGGRVALLVTQNVDGLHQRAGSRAVLDLHGRLDAVVCLGCGGRRPRGAVQEAILLANPGWHAPSGTIAPDGDADIDDAAVADFVAPTCPDCGGMLKPDVVFFGENVPRERGLQAREALAAADGMLVAGSSLMVMSGFRFARLAREAGTALAILNRGRTRADELADLRVDGDVGTLLQEAMR